MGREAAEAERATRRNRAIRWPPLPALPWPTRKSGGEIDLGAIDKAAAARIKAATGIDVDGFEMTLSADAVRHVHRSHGGPGEPSRGQVPVTADDFARIAETIAGFDTVTLGVAEQGPTDALTFRKRVNGEWVIVEAVRRGKRRLSLITMWKQQAQAHHAPTGGSARQLTPEASPRPATDEGSDDGSGVKFRRLEENPKQVRRAYDGVMRDNYALVQALVRGDDAKSQIGEASGVHRT